MDQEPNPPNQPQSITLWFEQLKRGNQEAAQRLWDRLFERLVAHARSRMQGVNRRVSDEEDIAIGVMSALCSAAERGELPSIDSREDLWRMLLRWTHHDIQDQRRYQGRKKRGGGEAHADSMLEVGIGSEIHSLDQFVSNTPPADVLQEMGEQYLSLLERLPNEQLRRIAIARMHGHSNEEVATQENISIRTVERKLNLIRSFWAEELQR